MSITLSAATLASVTGGTLQDDMALMQRWGDRGAELGQRWTGGSSWGRDAGAVIGLLAGDAKVATGWVNKAVNWPGDQLVRSVTGR